MSPESLADVLALYKEHLRSKEPAKRAEENFNQTQTAVYRYTLPGWGHPAPHGRKPTQSETAAAEKFVQGTPLLRLNDALAAQEKGFEMLEAKPSQRYTYRSKLKNFLAWAKKQDWWLGSKQSAAKNYSPKLRHGYGEGGEKRLTGRIRLPSYGLKPALASASLQAEVQQFYDFLTKPRYPGRKFEALKPKMVEKYLKNLYLILGWFSQYKGLAIENLSLSLLVPKVNLKSVKNNNKAQAEAEKAAMYIDSWLCDLLDFLEVERKRKSHRSLSNMILPNLRMAFNPNCNYVFVSPRTGNIFNASDFSAKFRNSAHRLTGQLLTPHLLRDIFATWFLDQQYTENQIESLAYAMGHSTEMLRQVYDRRRPQQKNRPKIEETMASLVQQFVR